MAAENMSMIPELQKGIILHEARLKVFNTINLAQEQGTEPDLGPVCQFYLDSARSILSDHDFKRAGETPNQQVLEILHQDVKIANRFAAGEVIIKGKVWTLSDLIAKEKEEYYQLMSELIAITA